MSKKTLPDISPGGPCKTLTRKEDAERRARNVAEKLVPLGLCTLLAASTNLEQTIMCESNNHQVGQIGSKTVRLADWDKAVIAFGMVIDDFNVRGQRDQIEHPGWCKKFRFCPECGCDLRGLTLRNVEINS